MATEGINREKNRPLVVIVGQTAAGKSALAVKLAQKYKGEIISADSRTIYKTMDIGTAKPVPKEQGRVRHHLLDIVSPDEKFTASDFQKIADKAIHDIISRGKIPFLVGGSGLYVDSVIFDYEFSSIHNPKERDKLNRLPVGELQNIVKEKKLKMPENYKNKRYLVRTIEAKVRTPSNRVVRGNTLVIGLKIPPAVLKEKITRRTHKMIEIGLIEEAKSLSSKYGWGYEPMKSIGYKEWHGYFAGEKTKDQTIKQIASSTNRFAKRQMTWFKRNKNIIWIKDLQEADKLVEDFISRFDTMSS